MKPSRYKHNRHLRSSPFDGAQGKLDSSEMKLIEAILDGEIDPAYAARARLIAETVFEEKPARILDAGCGRGFYLKLLSFFDFPKKIIGVDLNEKYLARAREITKDNTCVTVQKASLLALPFRNNFFDLIVCSEVLEHITEDALALKELHRVLKPGGTLVVTVPNKNFPFFWDPLNWILMRAFNTHVPKDIWWLAGIWADHKRLYTAKKLRHVISDARYQILDTTYCLSWCWPLTHFLLYGLGKNLVERCGVPMGDRFNFEKASTLSRLAARLMRLPSALLDARLQTSSSMNIVMIAQKR